MKGYVLSIAGAVLFSAVFSILSPEGRMGKFVRGMTKLFLIVVLVSPFVNFFGGGEFGFKTQALSTDTEYLKSCADIMERDDAVAIAGLLKEHFGVEADVETERDERDLSLKKILVKITDGGIIGQDGHIDIVTDIQAFLRERFGCEAEVS